MRRLNAVAARFSDPICKARFRIPGAQYPYRFLALLSQNLSSWAKLERKRCEPPAGYSLASCSPALLLFASSASASMLTPDSMSRKEN
jgi:hypothetical protein